jgi:pimeloyl-ACP methyl ester carboxylesterase
MWLDKSGSGAPAVVFLSGGGAVGLDYYNVHEKVSETTTSVLYDRLGTGWSERVGLPRTSLEVVNELRELLQVADVPSPYILVGHSLGGLFARHFAILYPTETSGLVLLDPAHEDYDAFMPKQLNEIRKVPKLEARAKTQQNSSKVLDWVLSILMRNSLTRSLLLRIPPIDRYRKLYRTLFTQEMRDWPDEIRSILIESHTSPEWLFAGSRESSNLYDLYDEIRNAEPTNDVPMIILSSRGVDEFRRAVSVGETDSLLKEEIEGKWKLYSNLATSVTRGECRPVDAGHFNMHFRHPDLVLKAIHDLLAN